MEIDYARWGQAVARRLWRLFVVRLRLVWVVIFSWAIAFVGAFFFPNRETGLRIDGVILQLVGLWLVLREIDSTWKFFHRPGFLKRMAEWGASLKRSFARPQDVEASIELSTSTGVATAYPPDVDVANTLEERVALLEKSLRRVRQDFRGLKGELRIIGTNLAAESSERKRSIAELNRTVTEHATKDLHLAAVGVLFVAGGMTMSTLAQEIMALIQ